MYLLVLGSGGPRVQVRADKADDAMLALLLLANDHVHICHDETLGQRDNREQGKTRGGESGEKK